MLSNPYILAIDQGTTSSRAIVFDAGGTPVTIAAQEFSQIYPENGWVEHDPEEIWHSTHTTCRKVLQTLQKDGKTIAAIGITNQRETTVIWDRNTGKAVYNAIVWQDRRTAQYCARLKEQGHEECVRAKTGLLLDPYFSATKIAWILDNVEGARSRAIKGELAFGTIDSFLLWRLTGGKSHATDATNASRTLLYNIHQGCWDDQLLALFDIPREILPEVKECASAFGTTDKATFGHSIAVSGMAGDQHAATIGQGCFTPGMVKSTYGTGCFVMLNTGEKAMKSNNRLLTTIAYALNGNVTYALEGSVFIAGAAIQWLRDGLKLIKSASDTETLARQLSGNKGVYLVPAFTGLGAPHWNPDARGAIFGLTRDTGAAELARAVLESNAYQTYDLLQAMAADGADVKQLRVDGGMAENTWFLQFLADILDCEVIRPAINESTALGAAYLAGLQAGVYDSLDDIAAHWQQSASFSPSMDKTERQQLLTGWHDAVRRLCA